MADIFIQSNVGGAWSKDIGDDGKSKIIAVVPGVQTLKSADYEAIKDDPGFAARVKKGQFVILNKKEVDKKDNAETKAKEAKQKASKEVEALKDGHKKEIKKLKEKFNAANLHLSDLRKESDVKNAELQKKLDASESENAELKKLLDEATK